MIQELTYELDANLYAEHSEARSLNHRLGWRSYWLTSPLTDLQLAATATKGSTSTFSTATTAANTGADPMTSAHMLNWLECLRSRKQTHAPVEAGYQHSIACIMANAAARTGERVTFDEKTQEVMAGGKVFHL